MANNSNYTDDNIKSLEGIDHIRLRPGMYIGRLGDGKNPGDGIYVAMDSSLSLIRSNSGMLYFNHPNLIQPVTFKNMILDSTGELTAERMFEMEKEYAKQNWSTWAAYIG